MHALELIFGLRAEMPRNLDLVDWCQEQGLMQPLDKTQLRASVSKETFLFKIMNFYIPEFYGNIVSIYPNLFLII